MTPALTEARCACGEPLYRLKDEARDVLVCRHCKLGAPHSDRPLQLSSLYWLPEYDTISYWPLL
jgi:hypothetical protein